MKTTLRFFALLVLGACVARADNAPTPEPQKVSTFKMEPSARNPFWPIGWKPVENEGVAEAGPDVPPSVFAVTSITLDPGAHFAIINGKTMTEGQQFGLQLGAQTYQITVKSIQDGRVILARRNEEIIVPLRRK